MDPITALIFASIVATLSVRTAGTAVSDAFHSAKGNEPPSLKKWRENQELKAKRGEKRETTEPSPWRRRWNNSVEYRNAKAAQEHAARMEDLRDNGRDNVDGHKQRIQRRRQRRDSINTRVAGLGASSWEIVKKAAEAARERGKEQPDSDGSDTDTAAWVDDEGRGHPRQWSSESGSGWELPVVDGEDGNPYCVHPDGSWSPYEPVSREAEDAVEDGTVVPFQRPGQSDDEAGDSVTPGVACAHSPTGRHDEQWRETTLGTRKGCIHCGRWFEPARLITPSGAAIPWPDQHHADSTTPEKSDPEKELVRDPDNPIQQVSIAELQRRRAAQDRQAEREHQERLAHIQQGGSGDNETDPTTDNDATPSTDDGEDTTDMNTTTEITDLDTATSFARETVKYADTVAATLSDMLGQLDTAAKGLAAESGQYEQGQASLEEEGFGSKVTGRFAASAEALNTAAEGLRQAVAAVTDAAEQVSTAGGEMRVAAKTFADQQAVAEQIGAAAQDGGVSKRTNFYASV